MPNVIIHMYNVHNYMYEYANRSQALKVFILHVYLVL